MLAGMLVFFNSLTVFAYPDVKIQKQLPGEEFNPNVESIFVMDGYENPYQFKYEILYDNQFTDEEGNIYPILETDISTMAIHTHRWASGTKQEHEKTADGGCIVTVYNARRCLQCGIVEKFEKISTFTSEVCPH